MLVSLLDMKSYLGLSNTSEYDSFLTSQIQIVSDAVEGYCNRKFEQASYVQKFYREDFDEYYQANKISLFMYPVVNITEVKEFENEQDLVGQVITDFRLNKPTGIIQKSNYAGSFFDNGDILQVSYLAGYSSIPALITSVVYSIVQERYNKKSNGIDLNFGSDIQRISIPGTIGIDFDYSLQNNERKTHFGSILGNYVNVLDSFRSDTVVLGPVRLTYVD